MSAEHNAEVLRQLRDLRDKLITVVPLMNWPQDKVVSVKQLNKAITVRERKLEQQTKLVSVKEQQRAVRKKRLTNDQRGQMLWRLTRGKRLIAHVVPQQDLFGRQQQGEQQ